MANRQNITDFMNKPFGRYDVADKVQQYSVDYSKDIANQKLKLVAFAESEGAYYYHISLPSKSGKGSNYTYDVVVRFFTDDPAVEKSATLIDYYVQFFSNSPSFIYQYAVLYKKNGALIEALYDKLDPEYADKLPEKTNANLEVSFDRSIWYACKFLVDHKFAYLNKVGMILQKKKPLKSLLSGIRDVKTVSLERALITEEQRLKKDMNRYQEERKKGKITTKRDASRKLALQNTLKNKSNTGINVKRAVYSTTGKTNVKKRASHTTRK